MMIIPVVGPNNLCFVEAGNSKYFKYDPGDNAAKNSIVTMDHAPDARFLIGVVGKVQLKARSHQGVKSGFEFLFWRGKQDIGSTGRAGQICSAKHVDSAQLPLLTKAAITRGAD